MGDEPLNAQFGDGQRGVGDTRPGQPPFGHDDEELARTHFSEFVLPAGLFLVTVFTTLWAGAYAARTRPMQGAWDLLWSDPSVLSTGIPFAGTLLLILLIVVIIFGASKLPLLGRGVGEGIRNFKKGLKEEEPPEIEGSKDDGPAESASQ